MIPLLLGLAGAAEPAPAPAADEVLVVTGTLLEERQDRAVVRTQVITRQQIEDAGARSLADVLELAPGLQVRPGLAGPVVQARGMDADHTLIVLDGARLTGRVDGGLDLRRFSVEDLEQVEIVYGAGSTLWGSDALGAVIHLRTRAPDDGVRGHVALRSSRYASPARGGAAATTTPLVPIPSLDGTEVLATVEGGGKVRARATVEHLTAAGWDEEPEEGSTTGDATRRFRVAGRIDAGDAETGQLVGRAEVTTWRRSGVDAAATGAVLDRDHAGRQLVVSVEPTVPLSARARLTSAVHLVQWEDTLRYDQRGSDLQDRIQKLRDRQLQGRAAVDLALATRHLVSTGVDLQAETLVADRIVEGRANRQRAAAFAQHRWDLRGDERAVLTSGLRFDHDTWFGQALSPRIAALVVPTDAVRLRASAGRGFKAPDLRELFLDFANPAAGYRVDGNPALRPEIAWNGALGGDVRIGDGPTLSVEGFATRATDLIQPVLVDEGRFAYGNIASARILGAEAGLTWRIARVDADLAATALDARDLEADRPLPGRSPWQVSGGLGLRIPEVEGRVSARGSWASARRFYVGDEEVTAPAATLLDLRAAVLEDGPVRVEIGVDNVFDAGMGQPGLLLTTPRRVWAGVDARLGRDRRADRKNEEVNR
jgi:outer membrane receptor for ferrienterochelin and colicins